MPQEGIKKVSMSRILTYEEILRICEAAVGIGITKFKITGGEPLVRIGCADLIQEMKRIPGVQQVTLTTNGQQLSDAIGQLADAGIDGLNISLDSLQEDRYRYITGGGDLRKTVDAIDECVERGIKTKVNCLLQKQFNEDEIPGFAAFAFDKGVDVRFIELMPIGIGDPDAGPSNDEVLRDLRKQFPLLREDKNVRGNGPAVYYSLPGAKGSVGLISAMNHSFCERCNRIRLTSQGFLKPCLCFEDSIDVRPALGRNDTEALKQALKEAVNMKPQGHTFHIKETIEPRSMSQIGG